MEGGGWGEEVRRGRLEEEKEGGGLRAQSARDAALPPRGHSQSRGMGGRSCLSLLSVMKPAQGVVPTMTGSPASSPVAHRAPSMNRPWPYMPFSG